MGCIARFLRRLRKDNSGNATLLVALAMPALIGGSGLAVDTAQWYTWKRELQFAVDQAALAGAWARADSNTASTYASRAVQEFNANLAVTQGMTTTPQVALANYGTGTQNSVTVSATASKPLPFSGMLTNEQAHVYVSAQAKFSEGESFTSCLIAVDDDDSGAITIGGNATLTAGCGLAALSTSPTSVIIDGNPTVDAGWVLSKGGIDDWLSTYTDAEIHEYMDGLVDPFASLTPPTNDTARTYTCVKGTKTTKAQVDTDATTTYSYWKGADYATAVQTTYNKAKSPTVSAHTSVYTIVSNDTVDGVTTTTTVVWTAVNGSKTNTIWEKATTVTTTTNSNVSSTTTVDQASAFPGTYTGGIKVACKTVFASGVYVIDGGGLEIDGQYDVIGPGVMFVLKNGAYIKINGGSNINLTAMTVSQLEAAGVSSTSAAKLAGMLIFEDRNSSGAGNQDRINGNASTVLNGTIYLPKSGITFDGTASVTSQCLMIAASTITISGTANMSTFCPPGVIEDSTVVNTQATVRLVA